VAEVVVVAVEIQQVNPVLVVVQAVEAALEIVKPLLPLALHAE
jgi:hypothetical protein